MLSAYDDGSNVVKLWADLRDSGFSPIFKMKSKMYRLHCPSSSQHHQVRSALQQLPTTTMAAASTTANIKHFELKIMTNMKPGHNGESVLDASAQPSTPLVISPPLQTAGASPLTLLISLVSTFVTPIATTCSQMEDFLLIKIEVLMFVGVRARAPTASPVVRVSVFLI